MNLLDTANPGKSAEFADEDLPSHFRPTKAKMRILYLEDHPVEGDLIRALLESAGFKLDLKRVDSEEGFRSALETWHPDLIISDYSLPSYNGMAALKQAQSLRPEIPFIFYSGTIGEEAAIDALKLGASDYVLKDRPKRLITAIQRAIQEMEQRKHRRESEERIQSLVDLVDRASDAIIVRGLDDCVQFWNKGAERLYGYTCEEIMGKRSTDFMRASYVEAFHHAKRATLQNGQWEGEMENIAKGQKPVLVTSRWTLMRDREGNPDRILAINTDITEKRKIEAQLLRAQRLECVGTLASGVAHDLNNVLAPILMGTEMLRLYDLDDEPRSMLETISRSAHRGAEVVKQLLTFVRGAEGRRVKLNLICLLRDVSQMAMSTFPKNIELSCDAVPDLWPIAGDPTQIHQVLMNLCINARDAMPKGGKLLLRARNVPADKQGKPQIMLMVEDSGTGMPPEVLEKIFDPFFTTKELGKGTGLGLATALGIIQSHAGTIRATSSPGKGTCFEIMLPAESPEAAPAASETVNALPKGQGELVLVVDDEPDIRHMTARLLAQHNYDTITAADGNLAILRFLEKKDQIRLVITDMMMPGVDGRSLSKAIKAMKPDVKLIATSGLAGVVKNPEAQFILKKPFSSEELLRRVHEVFSCDTPDGAKHLGGRNLGENPVL